MSYAKAPVVDYYDRELLVYRIVNGVAKVKHKDLTLSIYPPTTSIYLEACEIFHQLCHDLYTEGVPSQENMTEILVDLDAWSWHEEKEMGEIGEKLDELKMAAYQKRAETYLVNKIKNTLTGLELRLEDLNARKNMYFHTTCEGMAATAKIYHLIRSCTYLGDTLYDFGNDSIDGVVLEFNKYHEIQDTLLRYIAREDPWRTIWTSNNKLSAQIFKNGDRELTNNQKSLISWTRMYENLGEAYEPPEEDVIQDDDLLDGWFLCQAKKKSQEKLVNKLDSSIKSDKIRNSQEVYKIVKSRKELSEVAQVNSPGAQMIKKQRAAMLKGKGAQGPIPHWQFPDQQLKMKTTG